MPTMPPEATRRIGTTVTTSGALPAGQHTPADATAGTVTLALPTTPRYGASLSVEKTDATANTVVISGSIRGSVGTVSLGYQYETIELRADAGGTWRPIVNHLPKSAVTALVAATYATLAQQLLGWGYAQSFRLVSATRDANEAITTGSIVWPDGATGTFTTDTASTAFPGAIDAYHVTHVLNGTTLTVTQTAVTRDTGGAVTAQPALVVS